MTGRGDKRHLEFGDRLCSICGRRLVIAEIEFSIGEPRCAAQYICSLRAAGRISS